MEVLLKEEIDQVRTKCTDLPLLLPAQFVPDGVDSVATFPCSRGHLVGKRALDILLASLLLILALPIIALAALTVGLSSGRPIFFKQRRAGLRGQPFTLYKIRTMVPDLTDETALFEAEGWNGPVFKHKQDPRITRVGRWLRKSSLDELPQLVNVIRGDMSLVGPRPLPLKQVRLASFEERARLSVKPGITGLWQIAGRADIPYEEWIAIDFYYVQHRDLWLDLLILLKTIPAVLSGRGAY